MNARPPRSAESLVETVISLTVLVLAISAATSLVRISFLGNQILGQKVIALNLALEGIDAVQNIRDSNYLRFASNPEECWNLIPQEGVDSTSCSSAFYIEDDTTYVLARDLEDDYFEWELQEVSTDNLGEISLYDLSIDGVSDPIPYYAQAGLEASTPELSLADETSYTRTLSVDYQDANSFLLTVTVTWKVQDQEYSVSLSRLIANIY